MKPAAEGLPATTALEIGKSDPLRLRAARATLREVPGWRTRASCRTPEGCGRSTPCRIYTLATAAPQISGNVGQSRLCDRVPSPRSRHQETRMMQIALLVCIAAVAVGTTLARGHGTHTAATLWKEQLELLLREWARWFL